MWLWESIGALTGAGGGGELHGRGAVIRIAQLAERSALDGQLENLRGRAVLVATHQQLTAALSLIELDGVARRVVLCPPDLNRAHLPAVIRDAEVDACVRDLDQPSLCAAPITLDVAVQPALQHAPVARQYSHPTEWILLTSGTSGAPKLVLHTLASLCSAFAHEPVRCAGTVVWGTFYDLRRYGGLQILLRALRAGSMVLSSAGEPAAEFLARAAAAGVTHLSGTASHWRAALMSGAATRIAPRYVRLSGEIADQGILDALQMAYPRARVGHAYASTEAGVAFEVDDGRAGFPASLVGAARGDGAGSAVQIRIAPGTGTLQVRSPGNAMRYLGAEAAALRNGEGFVDNGDRIELRAGRYFFVGRSDGVINVGGLKVYPEEVEAVINSHPWVHLSWVHARRNPITGAVVTAEVVLAAAVPAEAGRSARPADSELIEQIQQACRRALPAHKVPVMIRIVPHLPVSAAGKLVRTDA